MTNILRWTVTIAGSETGTGISVPSMWFTSHSVPCSTALSSAQGFVWSMLRRISRS